METRVNIPSGLDHLQMIADLEPITLRDSSNNLGGLEGDRKMIGTAMSALYQAATCNRKCHGGPHVFEALCGRMYNLALGAYLLTLRGLYDEALNLIRSIGEVSNLIALSVIDKKALAEWLASDKKTRLRKFSPSEVRKAIQRQEPSLLLADDDWYTRFCEVYTHVTPQTKPNMHNTGGLAYAGGVYQPEGLKNTLDELATVLGSVSMIVCQYFNFSDLFEELSAIVGSGDDESINDGS